MTRTIKTALLVLMPALGGTATAIETNSIELAPEIQAKLEKVLTKSGGELTYFQGPGDMIGIGVTMAAGKQMVVYATADASTLFSGVAVDVESGANISNRDMQSLPRPNFEGLFSKIDLAVNERKEISAISEGKADSENVYYVFVDPKCPYCHKTYDAFLSELAEGRDFRVHYIPVGILGPESENVAKEMLGLPEPEARALMRKQSRREKHVSVSDNIEAGNAKHGMNLALFRGLQFSAVPVVVSSVGGVFDIRQGFLQKEVISQEVRVAAMEKHVGAGG